MTDKLEALKAAALAATPGPWYRSGVMFNGITSEQTFMTQGNKPHIANAGEKRDAIFIDAASPDVVLSLLAALKEKDQEIAKIDAVAQFWIAQSAEWQRRAEAAEQLLQQPIKLPERGATEINEAAWILHNILTMHGPINSRQFNNLERAFYEALKTCFKAEVEGE